MSNSNHSAKFINMLIALMASIAIALTLHCADGARRRR